MKFGCCWLLIIATVVVALLYQDCHYYYYASPQHNNNNNIICGITAAPPCRRRRLPAVAAVVPEAASNHKILVVGATGGTGPRALAGLLDAGWRPDQIRLLSRRSELPPPFQAFDTVQADLDCLDDRLRAACGGMTTRRQTSVIIGCYVHSTSSDTARLDTAEVARAQNLARALGKNKHMRHVVFNSAAGEADHGVVRIAQKHELEGVFGRLAADSQK